MPWLSVFPWLVRLSFAMCVSVPVPYVRHVHKRAHTKVYQYRCGEFRLISWAVSPHRQVLKPSSLFSAHAAHKSGDIQWDDVTGRKAGCSVRRWAV